MYSRNTDRGGRRIKLPPGYDGSAFRHDTGEVRRYGTEPEMKIHSPEPVYDTGGTVEEDVVSDGWGKKEEPVPEWMQRTERESADDTAPAEKERFLLPVEKSVPGRTETGEKPSFLEGVLAGLGSEEWLLFLVILLLVADGSDAWDIIVLLGLLLAVR